MSPTYRERTQGIYRCRYIGWREVQFPDKETGEQITRWSWSFQEVADPSTAGVIEQLTGTSLRSPNSNAYKIASGIIGRKLQADDDTEDHIGALCDVVYGPNQAGNLAITQVIRVQDAASPSETAATAAPAAVVTEAPAVAEPADTLPF